jgi:hypothetical protein
MNRFAQIFRSSRELVVLVPLANVLLVLVLWGVSGLTGRPVAVSLVPLVEFSISLVRVIVCGAFAALLHESVLGFRAEKSGGTLADDLTDAGIWLTIWIVLLHFSAAF